MSIVVTRKVVVRSEAPLNVRDFGADPTGTTDSTTPLQAAFNQVKGAVNDPKRGGLIHAPRGVYKHTGLNLDDTVSLTVEGEAGLAGGQGNLPASQLLYTGTGAGTGVSCRSADGLVLRDLGLLYSSNTWTGNMLDFQHSGGGSDAARWLVERCTVYPKGSGFNQANAAFVLTNAIMGTVRNCHLGGFQWAARGRDKAAGGYSNVMAFEDTVFDNCGQAFFANAGQAWTVRHCTFEMLNTLGIAGGTPWVYKSDYNVGAGGGGGITFTDPWFGDLGAGTLGFLSQSADEELNPLVVLGGSITGGNSINFQLNGPAEGVVFVGTNMGVTNDGANIDLGSSSTALKKAVVIVGNKFTQNAPQTVNPIANTSGHLRLLVAGNSGPNGAAADVFRMGGHFGFGANVLNNTVPVATALTGAGVSATATVQGNDATGRIDVTTGASGTGTGDFVDVTYKTAYDAGGGFSNDIPKVIVQQVDSNGDLNCRSAFGVINDRAGFRVRVRNAPAINTTYTLYYHAFQ